MVKGEKNSSFRASATRDGPVQSFLENSPPSPSECSKKAKLRDEILGFANLPHDWDAYDGHAPDQDDINNAVDFLEKIPDHAISTAESMVAGDGDVGFTWDIGDCHMEVGFMEGVISFYGKTPAGKTYGDDTRYLRGVPKKLQVLMDEFFNEKKIKP